jgi:ABC-type Fe3+/spermidine/putrescine transport system ATPase subunit
LISASAQNAAPGDPCKIVIRTSEVRLSNERYPEGTDNVLEGMMTSREYRGGLTDHRIKVGAKEIVVTSHKLCPLIRVNGDGGKTFLLIDKTAISIIVEAV